MRRLFLAGALLAAMLVPTASAVAAPHNPKGDFAVFADCPLSRATLSACIFSESNGGLFTIGAKTVPLVNPVILQGGIELNEETGVSQFYGAEDGNTLSKTPQPVPGGLLGITAPSWWPSFLRDLFNETINNGFTGVTATVELAKPATSIKIDPFAVLTGSGVGLSLPSRIKLSNPFLGSSCYIGTSSNPVTLNFTSGTTSPPPPNKPISGNPGTVSFAGEEEILVLSGGRLVDNAFGAPGASGCGGLFSFLVDPFVNSIVGVPSPAGTNTAILEGKIEQTSAAAVRAHE